MKKAAVISLKYHPGHYSHLISTYLLCNNLGYDSVLLMAKNLDNFDINDVYKKKNNFIFHDYKDCSVAFFLFPSQWNIYEIIKFRIFGKAKVIYIFHEPIKSYYNFYIAGFSYVKLCKLFLIDIINKLTVKLSTHIILPSETSLSAYIDSYTKYNNKYSLIPLFFDDESLNHSNILKKKRYISYIGTIAPDHAFNNFCSFIIFALENGIFEDLIFLIATSSQISVEINNKLNKYFNSNRLLLIHGAWLSNYEINEFYSQSLIIWNAYDRSNQSGVLPKSFMFSTPVLGNALIPNEYIQDRINGIYVKDNSNNIDIFNAINEILSNINSYCLNARNTFIKKFYYKNYITQFKKIINNNEDNS